MRWLAALGLVLAVIFLPTPVWAAVTCTAPQIVSADGQSCVDPPASPAASPLPSPSASATSAPSSAPTSSPSPTAVIVQLDGDQWATVSFGLGLLVFLAGASTVAGWRK